MIPVRINSDQNAASIGIDQVGIISEPQVPEDTGLVQVIQGHHILHPGFTQILAFPHLQINIL